VVGFLVQKMAPKAKPKGKHNVSALAKAVKTQRHAAPSPIDANTVCVDIRTSAAQPEFVIEDIGIGSKGIGGKKAPTKSGMKTALGGESSINVERRIRNGAIPLGAPLDDGCAITEELSVEGFDFSRSARYLMPRRPAWNYELSSGRLHFREAQGFQDWLTDVRQRIADRGGYPPAFEQNLQVWRQLWRVLERCDVAVIVLDARHPLLHLPPALVFHIVKTLRKPLVLVLNKLDVVDPKAAARWSEVLQMCVPGVMGVVGYSKEPVREEDFAPLRIGKAALIATCQDAVAAARKGEMKAESGPTPRSAAEASAVVRALARAAGVEEPWIEEMEEIGTTPADRDIEDDGRVMLGLIGHPNVGKSSLVNSLIGEKVVSVKATPGHTKTLQTMVLDAHTCLCDSPGVVFPRLEVPREAQIVGMLIPHGQVREPFSALRWVMEHATTPLHELLSLKPVTLQQVLDFSEAGTEVLRLDTLLDGGTLESDHVVPWSPTLICAQYATQRGLVRYGRPDCQAAGMEILTRVLEGRVPYSVVPPTNSLSDELRDRATGIEDSDGEYSDWGFDDAEFDTDEEAGAEAKPKDLLGMFGEEAKVTGACTNASRRRADRRKKLDSLGDGTSKKAVPITRRRATEEEW
jgi:ribosome biogenesis GTPase A